MMLSILCLWEDLGGGRRLEVPLQAHVVRYGSVSLSLYVHGIVPIYVVLIVCVGSLDPLDKLKWQGPLSGNFLYYNY